MLKVILFIFLFGGISFLTAQNIRVGGTIRDTLGNPILGVSIYNKTKTIGTTTDFQGGYQIKATLGEPLIFQAVGYRTVIKKIKHKVLNIILQEKRVGLANVAIKARSNINDIDSRKATGSIVKVDVKRIMARPSMNLMEALQGQVAGLSVVSSGELGKPLKIRIRGNTTLSLKSKTDAKKEDQEYLDNIANQPLFVLDGQIITAEVFANLNPQDIKEIKVLKDAVANALYGIKAANGVIEIATKRGVNGKTRYNFSMQSGITFRGKPNVAMMDSAEKLAFEFLARNENTPGYKYSEEYIRGKHGSKPDLLQRIADGQKKLDSLKQINTDWFDELMRISSYHSYNLSARGGNQKNRYYVSGNFRRQGGKFEGNQISSIAARLNYDIKFSDKFTVYLNAGLGAVGSQTPNTPATSNTSLNYVPSVIRNKVLNYSDSPSSLIYTLNPYETIDRKEFLVSYPKRKFTDLINQYSKKTDNYQVNFSTNVFLKLSDRFYLSSVLGVNYSFDNSLSIIPPTARSQISTSIPLQERGKATKNKAITSNQSINTRVNYNPFLGEHHDIAFSANIDYLKSSSNTIMISGYGLPNKMQSARGINNDIAGRRRARTSSTNVSTVQVGFGLSLLYTFMNRLEMYGSYKADAASLMPAEKRWNYFSSVGLGYVVLPNREKFLLNYFKIKATYGITASLAGIKPSMAVPTYAYGRDTYLGYRDFSLENLFNKDLKPERNTTINIGFDARIFKAVNVSVQAYNRRTDEMLLEVPIPPSNGFALQLRNVGVLRNRGVEITFSGYLLKRQNFSWHTSFNVGYNESKVLDLYDGDELFLQDYKYPTYKEGVSPDVVYGLVDLGISTLDGVPRYRRADGSVFHGGDEKPNREDFIILGRRTPPFQGGWFHHFQYKNWWLSVDLYYNFGGIAKYATQTVIQDRNDVIQNGVKGQLKETWFKVGDYQKRYKNLFYNRGNIYGNLGYASTRNTGATDFVRINNITLRYRLSEKNVRKILPFFQGIHLSAQLKNIATFSNFAGGDPEAANLVGAIQPITTFSLNISF